LHGKILVVTAVNPDVSKPVEAQVVVHAATPKSVVATTLSATDIHARNTFEQRNAVLPRTHNVDLRGGNLRFQFPAASVSKLEIELI
jgi:alpha-L-arabinofuranosidase